MIAACPECRTQYRVDPQRLSAEGVRLRCTRCQTVFRVRAPRAASAPTPSPVAPAASSLADPPATAEGTSWSERLVLVATPDADSAKRWIEALQGWGLEAASAHDGVEAILKIHRLWPSAVVLDPQLPKMFGFQVCEVIKRNASLRRIGVVLIGAIHHPQRYRRTPSELYGADAYVEEPDMPDALAPILRDLGLPVGTAPPPPDPVASVSSPDAATIPPPVPPEATLPPMPPPVPAPSPPSPEATGERPLPAMPAREQTIPPAAPTAAPADPVAASDPPGIGSPEYDVVDPDAAPAVARASEVLAAAEPAPAPQPVVPAASSVPASISAPNPAPEAVPASDPGSPPKVSPASGPTPAPAVVRASDPVPVPEVVPAPDPLPGSEAVPAPDPLPAAEVVPAPDPAPAPGPEVPSQAQPSATAVEPSDPAADPEVEQAERLARIIISDVVLYNEDRFRAACEAGNVLESLEADMADGRAHFASRVPEHVRNARDFLADELLRVARSRGMA